MYIYIYIHTCIYIAKSLHSANGVQSLFHIKCIWSALSCTHSAYSYIAQSLHSANGVQSLFHIQMYSAYGVQSLFMYSAYGVHTCAYGAMECTPLPRVWILTSIFCTTAYMYIVYTTIHCTFLDGISVAEKCSDEEKSGQ